ncbi:hypothetical protein ACWDA3_59285 [Nonomuraea rubra]
MTDPVFEARTHLAPVETLHQVIALLNIPPLEAAALNSGAPPHRQQATIYAALAEWATCSAQAAEQFGGQEHTAGLTTQYAFLIESIDEHATSWWTAPGDGCAAGIEASPDTAETFARIVRERYLQHVADHLDDFDGWLEQEPYLRVSVWDIRRAADGNRHALREGDHPPQTYARVLKASKIAPHAVEIRTPLQVFHQVHARQRS